MTDSDDRTYLALALIEAHKGLGFTAPNPAVGAVVVKNNQVIAKGHHAKAGDAHAEAAALHKLSKENAEGATLYVTLEPCNHHGRTPPCTQLILEKKIARVVYGFTDPNSNVVGHGRKYLEEAGIFCEMISSEAISTFYQGYAWYCRHKRPLVTAKLALSLNGKIAEAHGVRTNITGPEFQEWVHRQRLQSDAILTTAKTIIQDDPYLNVRQAAETIVKPLYILDRALQTPLNAKIFQTGAPCCFFYEQGTMPDALTQFQKQGARCIPIATTFDQLNLTDILDVIGKDNLHNLWIEAGGKCFQSFVLANLMNKAYLAMGLKWLSPLASSAFDQDIFTKVKNKRWFIVGDESVCALEWDSSVE